MPYFVRNSVTRVFAVKLNWYATKRIFTSSLGTETKLNVTTRDKLSKGSEVKAVDSYPLPRSERLDATCFGTSWKLEALHGRRFLNWKAKDKVGGILGFWYYALWRFHSIFKVRNSKETSLRPYNYYVFFEQNASHEDMIKILHPSVV
jgi:hypothetical protein